MNVSRRTFSAVALAVPAAIGVAACGNGGSGDGPGASSNEALEATGPITVWLSNNEQEVEWGQALVDAWNDDHPDEQVTVQEVPAGESTEEVITAAITAGTTPDLCFNIAPAAVTGWVRQGGLVDLSQFDDGTSYIEERSGADVAGGYQGDEGGYYQVPWKANPVMVMYNTAMFEEAGIDPATMNTFDGFHEGAQKLVDQGIARAAIWPSPTNEFYQPWFDFYPLYIAQTDGTQLVEDGEATFVSDDGQAVADFWARMYADGLCPQEGSTDDAMATEATAMQIAGPWAIAAYQDAIDVGFMPVPTSDGSDAETVKTFADSKTVSMFTTSQNQKTAWEFLKFATSEEQDGAFLEATGQMPMREDLPGTYPEHFETNPDYEVFASQTARTVDVPSVPNSIEVWQTFREQYSSGVIFGSKPVEQFLEDAASEINNLVAE